MCGDVVLLISAVVKKNGVINFDVAKSTELSISPNLDFSEGPEIGPRKY